MDRFDLTGKSLPVNLSAVIPEQASLRSLRAREPGIHNPGCCPLHEDRKAGRSPSRGRWLWIPGSIPSYTFAQPFLGGQATALMVMAYGRRAKASVDATLTGTFGIGPGFTISGGRTDEIEGLGDFAPQFNVRWNDGVDNYMTYVAGNLTVGRYDPTRLANLGIGHNAVDAGGGYTYFNPQTGQEFSAVLGFTYGCFESRVLGAGPQIGYILPLGTTHQAYFNLKAYKEFAAEHRPEGWNAWFTLAISPAAPTSPPPPTKAMMTK
jgi:hypothetical protein